ncbi:MAG TPA: (d)CMP kinase [Acidimicrobiales bacterium]|nr:(d)CMP kinase [Acidimicrobiales bacterium]
MPVVAIDGPAGSGKSTVARAVAARLGVAYLDTGAMYRSVAFAGLERGIDPQDGEALAKLAAELDIEVGARVLVDGVDATAAIRGPAVTSVVSAVSAHPAVRAEMVRRQRRWADEHGGGVAEGRDIGTVVFPDADAKVFLTASEDERARRRQRDDRAPDVGAVAADLARRDALDSTRATSPLRPADDAVVIDTTGRTVDDVVDEVLSLL